MAVFLSYASDDNEDPKGWVTEFFKSLQLRLSKITGNGFKVLFDEQDLKRNLVEDGIDDMLIQAKALVAVVSPWYLNREWCTKERTNFLNQLRNQNSSIKPEERLFIALKFIDHNSDSGKTYSQKFPDSLRRQHYIEFFSVDDKGKCYEYPIKKKNFNESIHDLAQKIAFLFDRINQEEVAGLKAGTTEIRTRGNAFKKIYLAETTLAMDGYRNELIKELESRNYVVLPSTELPIEEKEIESETAHCLNESVLSIHLLDNQYNYALGDAQTILAKTQIDVAAQLDGPMLFWLPRTENRQDSSPNFFIDDVQQHLTRNADFIQNSFEDFKNDLFEKLNELNHDKR